MNSHRNMPPRIWFCCTHNAGREENPPAESKYLSDLNSENKIHLVHTPTSDGSGGLVAYPQATILKLLENSFVICPQGMAGIPADAERKVLFLLQTDSAEDKEKKIRDWVEREIFGPG
jgi:hypothetical protein